jgi:hypothetical protein
LTIQDLGSLGELIAAIATVATLAYLAIQIRENTRAVRSESRGRISSQVQGYASLIGGSTEVASVFTRGLAGLKGLSPEEQSQFAFLFSMIVNQMHDAHLEYRLGVGNIEDLEANSNNTLRLLQTPGGRDYWRQNARAFGTEFQAYVNAAIGDDVPRHQTNPTG